MTEVGTSSAESAVSSNDALAAAAPLRELACGVCGHFALSEDSPHEFAENLTDRLFCLLCGAHRLIQ